MKWQPIETAPKDGTRFLISNGVDIGFGFWGSFITRGKSVDGWCEENAGYDGDSGESYGTHWMRLPEPPKE